MTTAPALWTIDPALGARESFVEFEGFKTWVAVVGDEATERERGQLPLLLLHGGPGACHDYLESLAALSATGRRVIFYDQQGCGNSDQPDDPARWTVEFYVREVDAIREALKHTSVSVKRSAVFVFEADCHEVARSCVNSCESCVKDLLAVSSQNEFVVAVFEWLYVEVVHRGGLNSQSLLKLVVSFVV